jgi:hypothetical protein
VFYALLRRRADTLQKKFARINAAGHHTVVLSCEHFSFLSADAFRALKEATGASEFQIVYTCRRWSDRIGSLWNHALFSGSGQTFLEFYFSLLAAEPLIFYPKWMVEAGAAADLDYSINWDMLASVFGRDAVSLFPYSTIMDRKQDVFDRFCKDVLGLSHTPQTRYSGQRRWPSMSVATQEIVRALNDMNALDPTGDRKTMAVPFAKLRRKYDLARLHAAIEVETTSVTIDDANAQFAGALARMSRYNDRVIGGGALFDLATKAVTYARPGYLMREGVREDLQAIYDRIESGAPAEVSV